MESDFECFMGDEVLVKRREGRSDRSTFCAGWAAVLDLLQEFVDWRVQRHPQVPRIGLVLILGRKRILFRSNSSFTQRFLALASEASRTVPLLHESVSANAALWLDENKANFSMQDYLVKSLDLRTRRYIEVKRRTE